MIPDAMWMESVAATLGLSSPALRPFVGLEVRMKGKDGVFVVSDIDAYGSGPGIASLARKSGVYTKKHHGLVNVLATTLRECGMTGVEQESRNLFADLCPAGVRCQGPSPAGIVPDLTFVDSSGCCRIAEVKTITSLAHWYRSEVADRRWRAGCAVAQRSCDTHKGYIKHAVALDSKYHFVTAGSRGPILRRLMTEFGPIQEVRSRFGVSELDEATPVFTLDFGVLCEYGDGVFALLDMAAVSRQRQVTSGLLLDSDYLSVIKHSLRKNLSIAVWKANARSMLDMAKMLSLVRFWRGFREML